MGGFDDPRMKEKRIGNGSLDENVRLRLIVAAVVVVVEDGGAGMDGVLC